MPEAGTQRVAAADPRICQTVERLPRSCRIPSSHWIFRRCRRPEEMKNDRDAAMATAMEIRRMLHEDMPKFHQPN